MPRLSEVEDMWEKQGREMARDLLYMRIGHAEYDLDYARARLTGLKKALIEKQPKRERTSNVKRTD